MIDRLPYGITIYNDHLERAFGEHRIVWHLPQFPLETGFTQHWAYAETKKKPWKDGLEAYLLYQDINSGVLLTIQLRVKPDSSFLRLRYALSGDVCFSGIDGDQPILYGKINNSSRTVTEIQLSQFDRISHSFVPSVERYEMGACVGKSLIGPILLLEGDQACVLIAYEHGAQAPDHFLTFMVSEGEVCLSSHKGNYVNGQKVGDYRTPWLQIGFAATREEMYRAYRYFMLCDVADNAESRKPYIFYNTWHHQEGKKYLLGNSVLQDMKEEFILRDIDIAHQMGVEVYVIDTGWYQKTGDWQVNEAFFPRNMQAVRDRLTQYGMKLGLWLNPIVAAVTSSMYRTHPEYVMKQQGMGNYWGRIWETEESYGMCLASGYSDLFIEQLVSLYETLGVRYFKWDAVGQYGCDAPGHFHGKEENSPVERADAYAYRMGLEMIRIAENVTTRCPEAIIDFDITEGGRFVGLGFLSVGKYFLINNGPYFHNLDIPASVTIQPDTINAFFYPGPARAQICRQSARFDFCIPSVLFLTHFLPHGAVLSQRNNMAALALGGNGIWGFLEELSEEDIARWETFLTNYKLVRDDVVKAYPIQRGLQGGSPEIHEKINHETGRGFVIIFTHTKGRFEYVTQPLPYEPKSVIGCDSYGFQKNGSIRLIVTLETDAAQVVFFV